MKIREALSPGGPVAFPMWAGVTAIAVISGAFVVLFPQRLKISERQREVVLFAFVSLIVGAVGIFVFLRMLSYYTAPWYYLALLALIAVTADAILGVVLVSTRARIASAAAAVLLALIMVVPTRQAVRQRMTDVDLIADDLRVRAQPMDLIVVTPWHFGITFTRYYRGAAPWVSVPMLGPLNFVRYDLVVRAMMLPDQTAPAKPIIERIASVLQSGNTVYVAGGYPKLRDDEIPQVLPPAPWKNNIWDEGAHEKQWDTMVRYFIKQHSTARTEIPINVNRVVSSYERVTLDAYKGWKP
jgi:hypothetical protein